MRKFSRYGNINARQACGQFSGRNIEQCRNNKIIRDERKKENTIGKNTQNNLEGYAEII